MTSIKEIQEHRIIGNAYHDQSLMDVIDVFVLDDGNSMSDKIKALEKLDAVMGIPSKVTKSDVEEYIAQADWNYESKRL